MNANESAQPLINERNQHYVLNLIVAARKCLNTFKESNYPLPLNLAAAVIEFEKELGRGTPAFRDLLKAMDHPNAKLFWPYIPEKGSEQQEPGHDAG